MQTDWSVLSEADLAMLRYSLMRELAWIDWDGKPAWWWRKEHQTLLDVKQTTSARPNAPAGGPVRGEDVESQILRTVAQY